MDSEKVAATPLETGGGDRQRSRIGFPYMNLDEALTLASAIHANVGTMSCEDDQLAPWLDLSPKSSGYRVKLSSARMFGLIESSSGNHSLTDLGKAIIDPSRQMQAKAQAFLQVPLYSLIFENFKSDVLPPAAALEKQMIEMGVAQKQKTRARQVFEKSAEQAGFFASGKNRLVKPGFTDAAIHNPPPPDENDKGNNDDNSGNGGSGGQLPPDIDPIIAGLIARLPKSGVEWPNQERELWLGILKSSFDLVYKDTSKTLVPKLPGLPELPST